MTHIEVSKGMYPNFKDEEFKENHMRICISLDSSDKTTLLHQTIWVKKDMPMIGIQYIASKAISRLIMKSREV